MQERVADRAAPPTSSNSQLLNLQLPIAEPVLTPLAMQLKLTK